MLLTLSRSGLKGKDLGSTIAYISIGSNIGDRLGFCRKAVAALRGDAQIQTLSLSSLYETDPVDYLDQASFYNAAIEIETALSPESLLLRCQEIEGRLAKNILIPKGPRTIDLDILFYSNEISSSVNLTLPHPEVARRLFVLIPLAEIAPHFIHPKEDCDIMALLNRFQPEQFKAVRKCFDPGWETI